MKIYHGLPKLTEKKILHEFYMKCAPRQKILPTSSRINMYNTIIVPNSDYGDVIFGGCSKKDSHRLQLVQNLAVKSITGNRKHDSATHSFKK